MNQRERVAGCSRRRPRRFFGSPARAGAAPGAIGARPSHPGPQRRLGGISQVARATGIAASTIQRGLLELASAETLPATRTRKAGGGRKRVTDLDPTLRRDLDALVEPIAPGDPDSPLRLGLAGSPGRSNFLSSLRRRSISSSLSVGGGADLQEGTR